MTTHLPSSVGSSDLINLLHQKGNLVLPKPFEREIFLFDSQIAGTSHVEQIDCIAPLLVERERLEFFREPDNAFDPQAIVIKTAKGQKLGYVPKKDNLIFARLMDAGKLLYGRLAAMEKKGNWYQIEMKIYLKE